MIFHWTAETEDGQAFGSTVEAQPEGDDYRPVFAAARELAQQQYPGESVTVTEISYDS